MKELVQQLHSILSAKNSWQKRKRKLTTELLTLILMSKFRVGRVGEVVDMLSEFAPVSDDATNGTCVSPAAVSTALRRLPVNTFYEAALELQRSLPRGHGQVLALDGSKVRLPPSFHKEGFRAHRRDRNAEKHQLGLLSALVDVHTNIPVDWAFDNHFDERRAAIPLLERVPPGTTILCDRGYFSTRLVRFAYQRGLRLVMRLKKDPNGQLELAMDDLAAEATGKTVSLKLHQAGMVPVDLCRYDIAQESYFCLIVRPDQPATAPLHTIPRLASNSPGAILRLYHERWTAETFFKTLKTVFRLHDVRTTSPHVFRLELDVRCLAVTLVQLSRQHLCGRSRKVTQRHLLRHTLAFLRRLMTLPAIGGLHTDCCWCLCPSGCHHPTTTLS